MMRKLVEFSVKNALLVNLLTIFVVLAGVVSFLNIKREAFPNISFDVVTVRTDWTGAPPKEIEKLITIEIEDELKEVDGIEEMTSVSAENISMVVLTIDPDEKDKQKVVNDIRRAVDRVRDLPEDAEDPEVTEMESKNRPVINVSLSGDFDEHTLQRLARQLEVEILNLPDVARVDRVGWRDREIWVEVTPSIVDDYKLSLEDVILALRNQNLNMPGGTLKSQDGDFLVRTMGEFETAEEVRNVIIRANDLGNWVKVSDVATVQDTFEDDDLIEKTFGRKAITLTVVKKESGDILNLVRDVRALADDYLEIAPDGLQIDFFDDFSFYVQRRLNVLTNNGAVGLFLVIVSLLVFLSRGVAIMTALGMVTALCSMVVMMSAFGISINLITMFALIMVLGLVVDDAIVIAENVYRHLQMGKPPAQAAIDGASEVAWPVTTTVTSTIIVFLPIFYVGGIMGKYIAMIPVIVILTLAASWIESLLMLPSHLSDVAKWGGIKREKHKESKWFLALQKGYLNLLGIVVNHRWKALGVFMCIFGLAVMLLVGAFIGRFGMRFVLFPEGLIEEFFVRAKAPIGTSLEKMEDHMRSIEDILKELPESELDNFVTQVGIVKEDFDDPQSDRGSHLAQIRVFLTPEKTDARRHADDIIEELRSKINELNHQFEEVTFEKVRAGPPVGKPVSIRVRGDDLDRIEEAAEKVKERLAEIDGLKDIKDDFDLGKNEIRIVVDEEKATAAYLSVRDIANTVRNSLEGGVATRIKKSDEEIDVIVRFPEEYRGTRELFDYAQIPNQLGNLVPLKKVVRLEEHPGINSIKHFDRKRVITVTSDLNQREITPIQVQQIMSGYLRSELGPQYPNLTFDFGGEQEDTNESMVELLRAFLAALLMVFILLCAHFNSIKLAGMVISAIPFGICGVVFAFLFHQQPMSFMSVLGTIGLSGVVVNDSIVLVDFIKRAKEKGLTHLESVLEAGRLRLRPVILTSITTVFGLMPVAYGIGGSDPFIKPMALAIGWGLVFATILTLLIIPCLYAVTDDLSGLCGRLCKGLNKKTHVPE